MEISEAWGGDLANTQRLQLSWLKAEDGRTHFQIMKTKEPRSPTQTLPGEARRLQGTLGIPISIHNHSAPR